MRIACSAIAPSARSACRTMSSSEGLQSRLQKVLAKKPRVILGSESISRRDIMNELAEEHGFAYETTKAAIDEAAIGDRFSQPERLVLTLAEAKADAICKRQPELRQGLLLTCDQVVVHEGRILEKPRSKEEARAFILGYGKSPGKTVGAIVCRDLATGYSVSNVDVAEVHFEPIPEDTIELLLAEGAVMRCAGGLMIEHPKVSPHIVRMVGTKDSIMGLCKQSTLQLLVEAANAE